ncbi:MAG: GntR family transcriptional regulator [Lentisphaeria bacterium]|nr:GntR family transcriptional regulator [Lentisphaeria bacterium]
MQILFKNDFIYNLLRERIKNGTYPVGYKFPPELEFAKELKVGKVTLRAALARLEHEKIVVRMRSRGTFVANAESPFGVRKLAVILDELTPGSPMLYLTNLLQKAAEKRGIVLEHIDKFICENLPAKQLKAMFKEKQIEGVLLNNSYFTGNELLVKQLRALKLPVVLPQGEIGDAVHTGFASVTVDRCKAFGDTLEYALSKSFRNIAVLGYYMNGNHARGYSSQDIQRICGKSLHSLAYLPYDLDKINSYLKEHWDNQKKHPDVFVCFSDLMAILLLFALEKKRILVPKDVSVIGYSGFSCDFQLGLTLTGIKYRYREMVEKALELMEHHTDWYSPNHEYVAPEITMPCDFIEGDSVRK